MRTRWAFAALAAAALVAGGLARLSGEQTFSNLDLDELREEVESMRTKANALRRRVGLRERKISEIEVQARGVVEGAKSLERQKIESAAEDLKAAHSQRAGADILGGVLDQFGGGWLKDIGKAAVKAQANKNIGHAQAGLEAEAQIAATEVQTAQQESSRLYQDAQALKGEHRKLALKAELYDKLADAKELLLAAEILRQKSETMAETVKAEQKLREYEAFAKGFDIAGQAEGE